MILLFIGLVFYCYGIGYYFIVFYTHSQDESVSAFFKVILKALFWPVTVMYTLLKG